METRRGFKADHESLARFLMSDQVADPARKAANDIRDAAEASARALYSLNFQDSDSDGTHYVDHFKVVDDPAVVQGVAPGLTLEGGPRRSADVINDVGYAAVIEWGKKISSASRAQRKGKHILRRAGQPWHSNKRGA